MKKKLIIATFYLLAFLNANSQCNSAGGINAGTITPTAIFQTVGSVDAGDYYIANVSTCNSYTFTFCQGGGSASFDTQITITDLTGTPITGAYNDDFCSTQSQLIWTPIAAGNVRVYITRFSCLTTGGSGATMAYRTVPSYTNTAEYTILGNAVASGSCTTLTANSTNQTGCAWDVNSTLNFLSPFSYDFIVNLGSSDAGADGTAFVMQNDTKGRCACGTAGGSVGAGGIGNSLIIEIDTYLNAEDRDDGMPGVLCTGGAEPDHLDVWLNGNINPAGGGCPTPAGARIVPAAIRLMSGAAIYNIENGLNHIFRVSWAPGSPGVITAQVLDAAATTTYGTISYTFTPLTLFGTNTPFFGFTASTGGLSNQQSFCNPSVLLPVELISFEAEKENQFSHLTWVTATEKNCKQFEIECSIDGINWKSFSVVPSKAQNGNSNTKLVYNAYHIQPTLGINYYRIKQIDIDLKYHYSPIRIVKFEKEVSEFQVFPNPASDELNILLGDIMVDGISIYNAIGQVVFSDESPTQGTYLINTSQYANGIYYVSITSGNEAHSFKLNVNHN